MSSKVRLLLLRVKLDLEIAELTAKPALDQIESVSVSSIRNVGRAPSMTRKATDGARLAPGHGPVGQVQVNEGGEAGQLVPARNCP